jgi:hypothetical protein
MKVIKYKKSFAEEKAEREHYRGFKIGLPGFILGIIILISCFVLIYFNKSYFVQKYGFLIFLLMIAGFFIAKFFIERSEAHFSQRDIAEKGIIGEERIEEVLKNYPDDYILVFNYEIPEPRIGDIDALLISPKGIFILESKNYNGTFRLSGSDLYKKTRFRTYKLLIKNVVGQIKRQKEALERYLKNNGIEIPIYPFLVFTSNHSFVEQPSPQTEIFVTHYKLLPHEIYKFENLPNYSPELQEKILKNLGLENKIQL